MQSCWRSQKTGRSWILSNPLFPPEKLLIHYFLYVFSCSKHTMSEYLQGSQCVSHVIVGPWCNFVTAMSLCCCDSLFRENICNLFLTLRGPVPSVLSGSCVGIEGSTSLRRASSMRRTYTTGVAGTKRNSTSLQVKFQMVSSVTEKYFTEGKFG